MLQYNKETKEHYSFPAVFFCTKQFLTEAEAKKNGNVPVSYFSVNYPLREFGLILKCLEKIQRDNHHLEFLGGD